MSKRIFALVTSSCLASVAIAPTASSAIVDTFSFSISSGWSVPLATTIFGQFTGTVEPDGLIELGDLSSFQLTANFVGQQLLSPGVGNLLFFTYNTGGLASSLGIIDQGPTTTACAGAPSDLAPSCNPAGQNPIADAVMVFLGTVIDTTPDAPVITLISSKNTVPEPSTWVTMLLGFAGLGIAGWRRRRSVLAALSPVSPNASDLLARQAIGRC
jgi:PEP-CTERM motif